MWFIKRKLSQPIYTRITWVAIEFIGMIREKMGIYCKRWIQDWQINRPIAYPFTFLGSFALVNFDCILLQRRNGTPPLFDILPFEINNKITFY